MKFSNPLLILSLLFSFSVFAQSSYKFDNEIVMTLTQSNEEGEDESQIKFYSAKKHDNLGYQMDITTHGMSINAQMVYDNEARSMTTLIDQGAMKMAMEIDLDLSSEYGDEVAAHSDNVNINLKKTGNTKKILGYKCEEYEMEGEDGEYSVMWMTDELDMASFFEAFSKMNGSNDWDMDLPEGVPMEITSWPNGKGTGEQMNIKVVEVNKNKSTTISTEGYSIMKMN